MAYLLSERIRIKKKYRYIPLRICITGARGKSSVTRLIASILNQAGFSVLAKTTGSKPVIIFPDGKEKEIIRRSPPSILEQKNLLKIGEDLNVQVLVSEMMSIQPESMLVESGRILRPHILIITNVRVDHIEHWGTTKEEAAACFSAAVPGGSTVFIPTEEMYPVFQEKARKAGSKVISVSQEIFNDFPLYKLSSTANKFEQNIRLCLAVSDHLGIDRSQVKKGIASVQPDFGCLKAWKIPMGEGGSIWHFLSAFAANDPISTRQVLEKINKVKSLAGKKFIGLLNLRGDRGGRTLQWLKAVKRGDFPEFDRLVLSGEHALSFKRKLRKFPCRSKLSVLKEKKAEKIMDSLLEISRDEAVVIGMGNMGGAGEELVKYWQKAGEYYAV